MKMKCKYCDHTAWIVRRYKDHEYRLCPNCNIDFITHEDKDKIIVDDEYQHRKQFFKKKGE